MRFLRKGFLNLTRKARNLFKSKQQTITDAQILAASRLGNALIHEVANDREFRRYIERKRPVLDREIVNCVSTINFVEK
jgi:hypothetical protein